MKEFKELDDFKKASIDKNIELVKMFLYLMHEKKFDDNTISMMKQNYHLMGRHLEEMGVVFDDKDKIKELNEKVRLLEDSQNMTEMSYNKVSAYTEQLKEKVKNKMTEIGLSCSVSLSFSPNIIVKIQVFNSEARIPDKMYYNDEDSFNQAVVEEQKTHNAFIENFNYEYYYSDGRSLVAIYDESNIEKIKNAVEDVIYFDSSNVKVELQTRFKQNQNGHFESHIPALKEIEITFLTLEKDIMLSNAFKSFR